MNLQNIFEEQLPASENEILEEGIFKVSPAIAFLAFKDEVLEKANQKVQKGKEKIENKIGEFEEKSEIKKAKRGSSGRKDEDTVYKLTKEQKKVMAYLYRKYGSEIVNKINDFRINILAPYQVVKRNVEKNHSLNNKEVFGMTKEEYYKYRESGRKKIERRGTYFKDAEDLRGKSSSSREDLIKAKKALEDFKSGKLIDPSVAHIDKMLDSIGLGDDKLYGWTERELRMTFDEIKRIQKMLDDPKNIGSDDVLVFGRRGTGKARYTNRQDLKREINLLKEKGYNSVNNKTETNSKRKGAPFSQVFNTYLLRRENMSEMKRDLKNSQFKELYVKTLEDAIKEADKSHKEKLANYTGLRNSIELNNFEKKIWGKKILGTYYSGNINDWYLKIKPEDFFKTKYFEKNDKVLKAEKEIDSISKRFERELKKMMSEEDLSLCKKYRLFNNLITVKQLKNPNNLFKSSQELNNEIKNIKGSATSEEDLETAIQSAMAKEYNSIRDLEAEQSRIKKMSSGKKLEKATKEELEDFLSRIDPKGNSKITKISRQTFDNEIKKIINKEYTGKTDAENDLKKLNSYISDFKELNGEDELKPFINDIRIAKENINTFLKIKEDE